MILQFNSRYQYQIDAVNAVVNVFDGQPLAQGAFEVAFTTGNRSLAFTEKGIANNLVLPPEQILTNVRNVQGAYNERNRFLDESGAEKYSSKIALSDTLVASVSDNKTQTFTPLNFTIEMETGTGKTYTYLRTVYELNKVYGFKKFVIVVPSVAIREGTITNIRVTEQHFKNLYGNPPVTPVMYEGKNINALRNFAVSDAIQIMVINIDSFTRDTNIINTMRETGIKPIEYIQATNPIVIVDEPQNMETDIRRAAIHNLNPLCTLRYSATHRNLYNLLYSLNPVQAYDLGLVKQIEVDGITSDNNYNAAFIDFKGIKPGKKTIKVKLGIYADEGAGVKQKEVNCEVGDNLFYLSGERDIYRNGFILNNIRASEGEIEFSNGLIVKLGDKQGGLTDEVLKFQIERTVKWHFEKVKRLKPKGIKVLSLFFIDKVANYREYDADGNAAKGKFARWFEEAFNAQQAKHPDLIPFEVERVHNGYFSSDKQGKGKEKKEVWTDTKGTTAKDDDTYSLIMREKERLLSTAEPLQFIFSHSALREGWDNPNVFQICTLNESKSELKKRQEIGRGLRLPVDSNGQQVHDKKENVLTVVANETYEEFSESLQREIQEETSIDFTGRVKNARAKAWVRRNKELTIENYPLLFEIWEKISKRTRYHVEYDTTKLIEETVKQLKNKNTVPPTKRPLLEARTTHIEYTAEGVEGKVVDTGVKQTENVKYLIPDVYSYIQARVDVMRNTIYQILKQSERYSEIEINPQMFLDNVVACIQRTLNALLVEGVKYTQINTGNKLYDCYQMDLLEKEEIETYLSSLFAVTQKDKTVFDHIPIDSTVESDFARDCEIDPNVKFFFKLPRAFYIPTPVGTYRPDWAVVFENDKRIYFVAETKGTLDKGLLRQMEKMKIDCGEKHFALFKADGVEYKLAVKARDLY